MIIPIRCVTCGAVIADKWEYYVKKTAEQSVGGEMTPSVPIVQAEELSAKSVQARVMDEIGLTRICCRRHMLGNVDLMDLI